MRLPYPVDHCLDPMTTYCLEAVYAKIVGLDMHGKLRVRLINRPTQTTASPSHSVFAASCRLSKVSVESPSLSSNSTSYPKAVLPVPGGPHISVTWPRFTPPC